ncbi:phosphate ABC transporter, periplasmic phosphate-binding protein [Rhizobium leguminosarum bv. trifolii WSM1325]|uniref:Phosphate-binding protein PstS n=1 Tax=Rhizobium leguminosarum bv. trifolii (strain WSM1325) TaxID=395491 RepID=C6AUC2_RHILS|nr:phosphate ABC transporter, periplasmic phosphate-binding protein [Rhizobium leguminosarum bv. trifolii WSM1325]
MALVSLFFKSIREALHMLSNKLLSACLGAGLVAALAVSASAADITGAGSTFVYPVLSKWSADYNKQTGDKLNYQSIGSGGGIAQVKAATVDFGASDAPIKPEDLTTGGFGQFPLVVGGIVPVINVKGIKSGELKLTGKVLADIYLGNVTKWNDKAIADLNPGLKLPDSQIAVVHRSDGSGTSFNWTNYFSKVNEDWKSKVGEGTAVNWPVGIGGKGNEGVAAYVTRVKDSIGYVEYAYALQNKLPYVLIQNAAGQYPKPNAESFSAAAASAEWTKAQDFYLIMTNAPGEKAWPVTATTWAIMYKEPKDAARSKAAFAFFKWALENGQKEASALDYVPLPETLVKQIEDYWTASFKG